MHDLIIVGGGAAAMSAGLARAFASARFIDTFHGQLSKQRLDGSKRLEPRRQCLLKRLHRIDCLPRFGSASPSPQGR